MGTKRLSRIFENSRLPIANFILCVKKPKKPSFQQIMPKISSPSSNNGMAFNNIIFLVVGISDTGYFNYGTFVTGTAWCDLKRRKGMRAGLHRGIVGLQCSVVNGQKNGLVLCSEVATSQSSISR